MKTVATPIERTFAELAMNFYVFFLDIPDDGMFENAETSLVSQVADVLHRFDRANGKIELERLQQSPTQ